MVGKDLYPAPQFCYTSNCSMIHPELPHGNSKHLQSQMTCQALCQEVYEDHVSIPKSKAEGGVSSTRKCVFLLLYNFLKVVKQVLRRKHPGSWYERQRLAMIKKEIGIHFR